MEREIKKIKDPFTVRVKTHVYKLLRHEDFFGDSKISLERRHPFGEMIYRSMSALSLDVTKTKVIIPAWYLDKEKYRTITITPEFELPETAYNEFNLLTISVQLEEVFDVAFLMFVKGRMDKTPNEVESVERFMEDYQIDNREFHFDAFKKRFQRFKLRSYTRMKKAQLAYKPTLSQNRS